MNRSSVLLCTIVAVTLPGVAFLSAQSSVRSAQPASSSSSGRPGAAAKSGIPDPALFDGSKHEPEKRPDRGMLAEFELPGSERPSEKVGGPAGEAGGGGAEREQSAMAASRGPVQNDPNAKAEGMSAENLEIPEGAQADQSAAPPPSKPQDVSLGDAAMQIQTASNQQNAVGGQQQQQAAQNTQQYEKGAAQGNQRGDNNNRGVERGQSVPQGL